MRPPNLRRYCTKRKPCRLAIPNFYHPVTTAEYVATFIHLNHLIP